MVNDLTPNIKYLFKVKHLVIGIIVFGLSLAMIPLCSIGAKYLLWMLVGKIFDALYIGRFNFSVSNLLIESSVFLLIIILKS